MTDPLSQIKDVASFDKVISSIDHPVIGKMGGRKVVIKGEECSLNALTRHFAKIDKDYEHDSVLIDKVVEKLRRLDNDQTYLESIKENPFKRGILQLNQMMGNFIFLIQEKCTRQRMLSNIEKEVLSHVKSNPKDLEPFKLAQENQQVKVSDADLEEIEKLESEKAESSISNAMSKAKRQFASLDAGIRKEILKEIETQLNPYTGRVTLGRAQIFDSEEKQERDRIINEALESFFYRKDLELPNLKVTKLGGSILEYNRIKRELMEDAEKFIVDDAPFKEVGLGTDKKTKEDTSNYLRNLVFKREFHTDVRGYIDELEKKQNRTKLENYSLLFFEKCIKWIE